MANIGLWDRVEAAFAEQDKQNAEAQQQVQKANKAFDPAKVGQEFSKRDPKMANPAIWQSVEEEFARRDQENAEIEAFWNAAQQGQISFDGITGDRTRPVTLGDDDTAGQDAGKDRVEKPATAFLQAYSDTANLKSGVPVAIGSVFNDSNELSGADMQQIIARRGEERRISGLKHSFTGKVVESYRRGSEHVKATVDLYDAAIANPDPQREQQIIEQLQRLEKKQMQDPIDGNLLAEMVYGAAGSVLPSFVEGAKAGLPMAAAGAAAGASGAAIAGQLGPQVALPEEAITVPAASVTGFGFGFKVGSTYFWARQGAGEAYYAMRREGADPTVSKIISNFAGVPYALIEQFQLGRAIPDEVTKGATNLVRQKVADIVLDISKRYGANLGMQTVQEVGQEAVLVLAEDLGQYYSDNDIKVDKAFLQERAQRLWHTTVESAKAFALVPAPGAAISASSQLGKRREAIEAERAAAQPQETFDEVEIPLDTLVDQPQPQQQEQEQAPPDIESPIPDENSEAAQQGRNRIIRSLAVMQAEADFAAGLGSQEESTEQLTLGDQQQDVSVKKTRKPKRGPFKRAGFGGEEDIRLYEQAYTAALQGLEQEGVQNAEEQSESVPEGTFTPDETQETQEGPEATVITTEEVTEPAPVETQVEETETPVEVEEPVAEEEQTDQSVLTDRRAELTAEMAEISAGIARGDSLTPDQITRMQAIQDELATIEDAIESGQEEIPFTKAKIIITREGVKAVPVETPEPQGSAPPPAPEPEPEPQAAEPSDDPGTPQKINPRGLSRRFAEDAGRMARGENYDNRKLRQRAAEIYGVDYRDLNDENGVDMLAIQESMSFAVQQEARRIALGEGTAREKFDALVSLERMSPNVSQRTSGRRTRQAYDTPLPLSYLAQEMGQARREGIQIYEPTAGIGNLIFTADPGNVTANEIDQRRRDFLEQQGVIIPTGDNAARETLGTIPDADTILMNPPFGKLGKDDEAYSPPGTNATFNAKDTVIASRALQHLKDDGRAVIIFGAQREGGRKLTKERFRFLNYLARNFNLVDAFDIAGNVYRRQGTTFPITVAVINGRQRNENVAISQELDRVDTHEEVFQRAERIMNSEAFKDRTTGTQPGGRNVQGGTGTGAAQPEAGAGGGLGAVGEPAGTATGAEGQQQTEGLRGAAGTDETGTGTAAGQPEGVPEVGTAAGSAVGGGRGAAATEGTAEGGAVGTERGSGVPAGPAQDESAEGTGVTDETADDSGVVPDGGTGLSAEEQAEFERLREQLRNKLGGQASANPIFDPEVFTLASKFGVMVVKRGARKFTDFVKEMVKQVGDAVLPYMKAVYQAVTQNPESKPFLEAMTPMTEVNELTQKQINALAIEKKKKAKKRKQDNTPENQFQIVHAPRSKSPTNKQLIPRYLKPHLDAALDRLEENVGDIDTYVQGELGYETQEELFEAMDGIQIETMALAIANMSGGGAYIMGHQTGVGKGRIAAGTVRWAWNHGKLPIFMTEKANLLSDLWRDADDVKIVQDKNYKMGKPGQFLEGTTANGPFRPIIFNVKGDTVAITDIDGNEIVPFGTSRPAVNRIMQAAINGDTQYNIVMLTYSQLNKKKAPQKQQLAQLMPGSVLIADESHTAAGGESNTGLFMQEMVRQAHSILFSSATWAKRPDNMALYARVGLADAVGGDMERLRRVFSEGGEPMQEVASAMAARAGVYHRAELEFSGLEYATVEDRENHERDRDRADMITTVLRQIIDFDAGPAAGIIEDWMANNPGLVSKYGPDASVGHTPYTDIVHNAVRQMLLSLKIDAAIKQGEAALAEGKKPVFVLEHTNGAFADDFMAQEGLTTTPGNNTADSFNFDIILGKNLRKTGIVRVETPDGDVHYEHVQEVFDHPEYKRILDFIGSQDFADLPANPLDVIRNHFDSKGVRTGEITGRNIRVMPIETGVEFVTRGAAEKNRNEIIRGYNSGEIEVLIMNPAGAAGLSLHASERFTDQRPRRMIIIQAAANIQTYVQTMGRIHRKGQVVPPSYELVMTDLPSENRPAAVLAKKMRSLNANTSANTRSKFEAKMETDILNEIGDEVVSDYLWANPEVALQIGIEPRAPALIQRKGRGALQGGGFIPNVAQRATGRMALLPIGQQQEIWEELLLSYNATLRDLEARGENVLTSKFHDFEAEVIDSVENNVQGGAAPSVWTEPYTIDEMSVVQKGKPLTTEELGQHIADELASEEAQNEQQYMDAKRDKVNEAFDKFMEAKRAEGKAEGVLDRFEDQHKRTLDMLRLVRPGQIYENPQTFERYVVLAVKPRLPEHSNPATPGAVGVRLAVPNQNRTDDFSLNQMATPEAFSIIPSESIDSPEVQNQYNREADTRVNRIIINGNLIAGFADVSNQGRPMVINYTDADGNVRQGLLMPQKVTNIHGIDTPVRFTADEAAIFLIREHERASVKILHDVASGAKLEIKQSSKRQDRWVVFTEATRNVFQTNEALTDLLDDGFVDFRKGREMKSRGLLEKSKLPQFIKALGDEGFTVTPHALNATNADAVKQAARKAQADLRDSQDRRGTDPRQRGMALVVNREDLQEAIGWPARMATKVGHIPGLRSSTQKIADLGGRSGTTLANSFHYVADLETDLHARWTHELVEAMGELGSKGKLTAEEKENYIASMRGYELPMNPKVQQAVDATTHLGETIGDYAEALKVPIYGPDGEEGVFRKRKQYYPLIFSKETLEAVNSESGEIYENLSNWIATDMARRELQYKDNEFGKATKSFSHEDYVKQAKKFLRDRREFDPSNRAYQNLFAALRGGGTQSDVASKIYRSLEMHRTFEYPSEFLEQDPLMVWDRHIRRASRRLAEMQVWGSWDAKKNRRTRDGNLRAWIMGGLKEIEDNYVGQKRIDRKEKFLKATSTLIGHESKIPALQQQAVTDPLAKTILRGGRKVTSGVQLFGVLPPIKNTIWGLTSTGHKFGYLRAAADWLRTIYTPEMRKLAREVGALDHSGIDLLFGEVDFPSKVDKFFRWPMRTAEVALRSAGAHTALGAWTRQISNEHKKALKAAKKNKAYKVPPALMRILTHKDVGFSTSQVERMIGRGKPDASESRKMMRGGVRLTQFTADAKDIPLWAAGDLGRWGTQFYAMAYKHTEHIVGYSLTEAGHGNLMPLARLIITAGMAGLGIEAVTSFFRGEPPDKKDLDQGDRFLRMIGNALGVLDIPLSFATENTSQQALQKVTPASVSTFAGLFFAAKESVAEAYKAIQGTNEKAGDFEDATRKWAKNFSAGRFIDDIVQRYEQGRGPWQDDINMPHKREEATAFVKGTVMNLYRVKADPDDFNTIIAFGQKRNLPMQKIFKDARQQVRTEFYDKLYEARRAGKKEEAAKTLRFLKSRLHARDNNIVNAMRRRNAAKEGTEFTPVRSGSGGRRGGRSGRSSGRGGR